VEKFLAPTPLIAGRARGVEKIADYFQPTSTAPTPRLWSDHYRNTFRFGSCVALHRHDGMNEACFFAAVENFAVAWPTPLSPVEPDFSMIEKPEPMFSINAPLSGFRRGVHEQDRDGKHLPGYDSRGDIGDRRDHLAGRMPGPWVDAIVPGRLPCRDENER
jgi:hypothetical protein